MRAGAAALVLAWGLASPPAGAEVLPPASRVDPYVARPRVIVLTDIANEPDDQMSLVRFLVYSNQYDVLGLVATTSTWMKNKVRPDVILTVLDAYDQVQPNLLKHAPGFPTAASLRGVVTSGQPGYGMAAVGPGQDVAGRRAHRERRADGRSASPLGPRLGRRQHPCPGPRARAGHEDATGARGHRREAARLHDLRPGRRRPLDPPRVPGPALRGHAFHSRRRAVLPRDLDGHQRRPVLPQRAGSRLHHVHRRVGHRERPQQGAARKALSLPLLHPRGRHAFVPGPHRQRPGQCHEPGLRRVGRPVRLAATRRRDAPLLDAGGRFVPRPRQLAGYGHGHRRKDLHVGSGHDLAVEAGVPERLRGAAWTGRSRT